MTKLLATMFVTLGLALGGTPYASANEAGGKAALHSNLSKDTKGEPAKSFGQADAATYVVYHGDNLKRATKWARRGF